MNPDFDSAFDEGIGKVSGWIEGLVHNLPNLIAAMLLLLVFIVVARRWAMGDRRWAIDDACSLAHAESVSP